MLRGLKRALVALLFTSMILSLTGCAGIFGGVMGAVVDSTQKEEKNDCFAPGTNPGTGTMSGSENLQRSFNFLVSAGYSKEMAAGIVGNLQTESAGATPWLAEYGYASQWGWGVPDNQLRGWGIVQWTWARHAHVRDYVVGKIGRNYYTSQYSSPAAKDWMKPEDEAKLLQAQLEFLLQEMQDSYYKGRVYDPMMKASTPEQAADIFVRNFEIPANVDSQSVIRQQQARALYDKYKDGAPTGGSAPTTDTSSGPTGSLRSMSVAHFGDSIAVGSSGYMKSDFKSYNLFAAQGRQAGPIFNDMNAQAGNKRDVTILHTGNNGYIDENQMRTTLSKYSDAKVVVVVIPYLMRNWNDTVRQTVMNVVGTPSSPRMPNVRVVDWGSIVKSDPSLLGDGVHPTSSGYQKYKQMIEGAIGSSGSSTGSGQPSTLKWHFPVDAKTVMTSPYGMRVHPVTGVYTLHTGVDFSGGPNDNLYAVTDGQVTYAQQNGGYGNMLILRLDNGDYVRYAHLSSFVAQVGQRVKSGDVVGIEGSTGYSTGNHLHFEVIPKGSGVMGGKVTYDTSTTAAVDPLPWLDAHGFNQDGTPNGKVPTDSISDSNLNSNCAPTDGGSPPAGGSNTSPGDGMNPGPLPAFDANAYANAPTVRTDNETDATARRNGYFRQVFAPLGIQSKDIFDYPSSSPSCHGPGDALDIMVPEDSVLGDTVAAWLIAHSKELEVSVLIWKQQIWTAENPNWRKMEDRGSVTQNHRDHNHVSFYPCVG